MIFLQINGKSMLKSVISQDFPMEVRRRKAHADYQLVFDFAMTNCQVILENLCLYLNPYGEASYLFQTKKSKSLVEEKSDAE